MVKNLPAVERSTKIRFGKNVPEATDQAENTIVFNASNVTFDVTNPNAVYLSPIRNRPDFTPPEVVLLMYDRNTKEITESGESANALVGGATLALTVNRSNVTSNTVLFTNSANRTGFVTDSNVGISNLLPQHTVSVGSNLYIDDVGSNVLVVSGNVAVLRDMVIEGNLCVNGETSLIFTQTTSIHDAIIELGANNTSESITLDLGLIMHRPDGLSNVIVGYKEGTDEFAIAYTTSKATDKTFDPKTDEDIDVHVYGRVLTEANVGIINTSPIHTLDVGSNLYVDDVASNILVVRGNVDFLGDLTVTENVYIGEDLLVTGNVSITEELTVYGNVYANKDIEVVGNTYVSGNVVASKDLTLTGNAYVSGNVVASKDFTLTGNAYVSGNVVASKDLTLSGNAYVSGNVVASKDLTLSGNAYVTGNVVASKDLLVTGNAYVSGNVVASKDFTLTGNAYVTGNVVASKDLLVTGNIYVSTNVSITNELTVTGNVYADRDLEVVGNTHVTGDVLGYKDLTLFGNAYVAGNVYANKDLTLSGNAYVTGNVVTSKDLTVSGNAYVSGNVVASKDLTLSGNAYVSGNVNVTKQLSVSGNAYVSGNVEVTKSLIVSANTHLKGDNVFITHTMDFLDPTTAIVTDQVSNVQIRLGQLENVSNTASNPAANQVLRYVGAEWLNDYPQQNFMRVKNGYSTEENRTLYKGNTVYISDTQNASLVRVKAAQSHIATSMPCVGLVYEDIAPEGEGVVLTYGVLTNLNTLHLNAGKTVYVSNVYSGYHTSEKPDDDVAASPDLIQNLGVCTRSHQSSGAIFVTGIGRANDIPNAERISELQDMQYVYVNNSGNDLKKTHHQNILYGGSFYKSLVQEFDITVSGSAETSFIGTYPVIANATAGILRVTYASASSDTGNLEWIFQRKKDDVSTNQTITFSPGGSSFDAIVDVAWLDGSEQFVLIGNSFEEDAQLTLDVTKVEFIPDFEFTKGKIDIGSGVVNDTTLSTSTTTGALTVAGGISTQDNVYVGRNVYITSNLNVDGTTLHVDSVSSQVGIGTINPTQTLDVNGSISTNDYLIHNGDTNTKIGFSGDDTVVINTNDTEQLKIDVNGNTYVTSNLIVNTNDLYVDTKASRVGVGTTLPGHTLDVRGDANVGSFTATTASVTDVVHSTTKDTGALIVTRGGLGVEANVHATNVFAVSHIGVGTSDTAKALDVRGEANVGSFTATSASVSDDTDSAATTSGAVTITGGLGVGKSIFAQDVSVGSLTHKKLPYATSNKILADSYISQEANGDIIIARDLQIVGNLYVQGNTSIVSANNLIVSDRIINIANNNPAHNLDIGILMEHPGHNIGIIHHDTDELTIGYTQAGYGDEHVDWDTSNHITVNVWGHVITQNTITIEHNDLYVQNGRAFVSSNITTSSNIIVNGDTASTSKTTGAIQVAGGVGVQGNIYSKAAFLDGLSVAADTDIAGTIGKAKVGSMSYSGEAGFSHYDRATAGNYALRQNADGRTIINSSTGQNIEFRENDGTKATIKGGKFGVGVSPSAPLHINGGTIINSDKVAKKTYSYYGDLANETTIENAAITITFSQHVFYAKIVAHLVESDEEVSTLSFECGGGNWSGGTPLTIAKGPQAVFGSTNTNPWDSDVAVTTTTVTFKPTTDMASAGHYNVFIEYISQNSDGKVEKITVNSVDVVTFAY